MNDGGVATTIPTECVREECVKSDVARRWEMSICFDNKAIGSLRRWQVIIGGLIRQRPTTAKHCARGSVTFLQKALLSDCFLSFLMDLGF